MINSGDHVYVSSLYVPSPTMLEFHNCRADVRYVCGPFGSGKSVGMIEEMMFVATRQKPDNSGVRRVRWGVLRASYPRLKTTTKTTIDEVYPSAWGSINLGVPMTGVYNFALPDGTSVNMEIIMMAIEAESDVEKLKSLNVTAFWINEATEIPEKVLDGCIGRIGRYPPMVVAEPTWSGVVLDFNPPPKGHWLHTRITKPELLPEGHKVFIQPPAAFKHVDDLGNITYTVNENADNIKYLPKDYYRKQIDGKVLSGAYDDINLNLCLDFDSDQKSGKPVWPHFSRSEHVVTTEQKVIEGNDVLIGVDTSGIHPAAAIIQHQGGRWVVLDELYGHEVGFEAFTYALSTLVKGKYMGCPVLAVCDPADARDSYQGLKPTNVLVDNGIPATAAVTNKPKDRSEAVATLFNKRQGGIVIHSSCEMLVDACISGYRYPKVAIRGSIDTGYGLAPLKNDASHIANALEYAALHILSDMSNTVDYVRAYKATKKSGRTL